MRERERELYACPRSPAQISRIHIIQLLDIFAFVEYAPTEMWIAIILVYFKGIRQINFLSKEKKTYSDTLSFCVFQ